MSLIVEDGTGLADAESYASVAYADTYHSNFGNAAWALLTTEQKEQSLRKATDYISGSYGGSFAGYRTTNTQALDFPRSELPKVGYGVVYYGNNEIPAELLKATAILALKSTSSALVSDTARLTKREKVDVLEIEYMEGASDQVKYNEVDLLLGRFFIGAVSDGILNNAGSINRKVFR